MATADQLRAVECGARNMLSDLGSGYRAATPLPTVEDFQNLWNAILTILRNERAPLLSQVSLPSRNNGFLVVEGLYGGQTATAVGNFLEPAQQMSLPPRAADVPTWWAQNFGAVEAMCTPAPPVNPIPPMPPMPTEPAVPMNQSLPSAIQPTPPPAGLGADPLCYDPSQPELMDICNQLTYALAAPRYDECVRAMPTALGAQIAACIAAGGPQPVAVDVVPQPAPSEVTPTEQPVVMVNLPGPGPAQAVEELGPVVPANGSTLLPDVMQIPELTIRGRLAPARQGVGWLAVAIGVLAVGGIGYFALREA